MVAATVFLNHSVLRSDDDEGIYAVPISIGIDDTAVVVGRFIIFYSYLFLIHLLYPNLTLLNVLLTHH